ncbi:hypothetical protein [Lonsdalea iberica]|uniref:Uncharacterized protein n=1 Tax=Lonsdalea iberica TaxID=1082703 RepID=A0A1X3S173_9GAMM|nr:hypothetical protein [Lonsdalea iberica]OSN08215.1 hypothetical protein AU511_01485 [Lonsdalea iberica]
MLDVIAGHEYGQADIARIRFLGSPGFRDFLFSQTLTPELEKKDRAIVLFIDDNLETMSISDISPDLNGSVAGITNVYKSPGLPYFTILKMSVAKKEVNLEEIIEIPVIHDADLYTNKVIEITSFNSIVSLQDSLEAIDRRVIETVAPLSITFPVRGENHSRGLWGFWRRL